MNPTVITEANGLKVWPTSSIVAYFRHGSDVHAAFDRPPLIPDVTPSSLMVSDVSQDGTFRKKIVFRVPETSNEVYNRLLSLLKSYIVAVYTDERGVERIMGSIQWPAFLSLERAGGSLNVTIEALGDAPNPEFILAEP